MFDDRPSSRKKLVLLAVGEAALTAYVHAHNGRVRLDALAAEVLVGEGFRQGIEVAQFVLWEVCCRVPYVYVNACRGTGEWTRD